MNAPTESHAQPQPDARDQRRVFMLAQLPFLLLCLAAAIYGLVQHKSSWWNIGMITLGSLLASWLSDSWIRREWPVPTPSRQAMLAVKASLLIVPLFGAASIGFMMLFPAWFPDSCPLPPR